MKETLEQFRARIAAKLDAHFGKFAPVVAAIDAGFAATRSTPKETVKHDSVSTTARIACEMHERGELSREDLIDTLERLIDVRALESGYAERFGLPSKQGAKR